MNDQAHGGTRRLLLSVAAVGIVAGFVIATATRNQAAAPLPPAPAVYSSNDSGSSFSALDPLTLTQSHGDVSTQNGAYALALSPDGERLYTVGNDYIDVIDTTTDGVIRSDALTEADQLTDVVVSPDNTKVYVTARNSGRVFVYDAVALGEDDEFPLQSISSNTPSPEAIDVSADGTRLFVLVPADSKVLVLSTADGSQIGSIDIDDSAAELKVSADGSTLIVIGDFSPLFFDAQTFAPVDTADEEYRGTQLDLAVAGERVYVLNEDRVDVQFPVAKPRGGPKGKFPTLGPAVDVYDAATGEFITTYLLDVGSAVLGIAAASDETAIYVSTAGFENVGTVYFVDPAQGSTGPSGSTGAYPRRLVVKEFVEETPVVSYFLPRSVNVKFKGADKDFVGASGFFDIGDSQALDLRDPVVIEVGGFSKSFTLLPKGAGFTSPKDPVLKFTIVPNKKGSSRGKFKLKVAKTTLEGLIDPMTPVSFHFRGTGLPDAEGTIQLTSGRYRLGKARGALSSPAFFPQRAKAKVGADLADSFVFVGGFATNGQTPAELGTVRFSFGDAFRRVISGTQFTKKGDVFSFGSKQGATKFSIKIDFLRETVTVVGKKVELGELAGPTTDFVFDAGAGAGTFRSTVQLGISGAKRGY